MATPVTTWGPASKNLPTGIRLPLEGHNINTLVLETGRPARIDRYADSSPGPFSAAPRETGIRSAVGTPVIVEGRLWGVIFAGSPLEQPLSPDTEARLASFTELVATAIVNADSRAELMAPRARIVAAADETRRRIERDLHDGPSSDWSRSDWRRAPRRPMSWPAGATCELSCRASRRDWRTRWPNCRRSRAGSTRRSCPSVVLARRCARWRGSGLTGLADRVETLGGSIHVRSAAGAGTHITVDLPLEYELAQGAG
jgi:GAF domain